MRRPGRSRAHERQRQNRVPFVRHSGADKPRRGGVFPRGDSPGGRLAPGDVKTPVNSTAIQNHGPSHRPSSTSLTESPLRGSAGVPLTCLAGRTLLLTPFTGMRHPHHASQSSTAPRRGTKREPGGPCPAARARASRRGLSESVSVPRWRLGRLPARRCFCPPPQPSARRAHGTAPVRQGYFIERHCKRRASNLENRMALLPLLAEKERKTDAA